MTPAAIARLLLYLGALIVVGDAALGWQRARLSRLRPAGAIRDDATVQARGTRSLVLSAWLLLASAVAALVLLQARDMELERTVDAARMLLTGTTWGRGWTVLTSAVLGGLISALLRAPRVVTGAFAVAVAVAMGGLGHAAADDAHPWLSRGADAVHVLSVGAWLGGLLLIAVRRHASMHDGGWKAYSSVATVAAPLAVVSGLLAAWRRLMLPPLDADSTRAADATAASMFATIVASDYAWLLLGKVVLLSIMLVLGLIHRRRVLRERAPSGVTVLAELVFALAVLMVTGELTGTAPPGE